jgi:hypothetical protein
MAFRLLLGAGCLVAVLTLACGRSQKGDPRAALEKQFEQSMRDVTLVGQSTRAHRPGVFSEKYRIDSVRKLAGDKWLFNARVQYEGHDLPVPVPLTVLWAGDTPVVTLTDLHIPGAGTFTARVLFYRGDYAGSWSGHGDGGQLWGKIVKGAQ